MYHQAKFKILKFSFVIYYSLTLFYHFYNIGIGTDCSAGISALFWIGKGDKQVKNKIAKAKSNQ